MTRSSGQLLGQYEFTDDMCLHLLKYVYIGLLMVQSMSGL